MKKHRILVILLAMLVVLSGCSSLKTGKKSDGNPQEQTEGNAEEQNGDSCMIADSLSSFDNIKYPNLVYIGGGLVLAGISSDSELSLKVIDVLNDTVLAENSFSGDYYIDEASSGNGLTVLKNWDGTAAKLLGSELNVVSDITLPSDNCVISPDGLTVYSVSEDGRLLESTVDIGDGTVIELQNGMLLSSVERMSDDGRIVCRVITDTLTSDTAQALVDVSDGSIVFINDRLHDIYFCDGKCIASVYENGKSFIAYGSSDAGNYCLYSASSEDISLSPIGDAPFVFGTKRSEDGTYYMYLGAIGDTLELAATGKLSGDDIIFLSPIYLADEDMFVFYAISDGVPHCALISPEKLDYTVTAESETINSPLNMTELVENYVDPSSAVLGEELTESREYADSIEKSFGVKVLISEQCRTVLETSDFKAEINSDPDEIHDALNTLEAVLSKYPAGMFRGFSDSTHRKGLRFVLVDYITQNERELKGASVDGEGWYTVAIDLDDYGIFDTVNRELWHTTEARVRSSEPGTFSDAEWSRLNPEDFEYSGDYDDYWDLTDYTYTNRPTAESYFYDEFSRISAEDDRAVIFEIAASRDIEFRDDVLSSPFIRAKLDYMGAAIERVFSIKGDAFWK